MLSNDKFSLGEKFYVSFKESGTWDPQDIYYNADNDELLIPISKKKDGSATCENIIKSVKLGEVSKGEHFDFYGEYGWKGRSACADSALILTIPCSVIILSYLKFGIFY